MCMLYLGADHRGFKLKEQIKVYLDEKKILYEDMGAFEYNKDDDYPDFAYAVAKKVSEDLENNRGIVMCGSGIGVNITANKVRGIRAALVWSVEAVNTLHDDNPNILSLPGELVSFDEAKKIIAIWIEQDGKTLAERHKRRLEKIENIENNTKY